MRNKHFRFTFEQKIILGKILLIFSFALLLTSCGSAETDIAAPTPTETSVPTPTVIPTATINPEWQALLLEARENFNSETLGFHDLYEKEIILLDNGQVIAHSPYDKPDDPHFTFDGESHEWVDNHPGRSNIEYLFPEATADGRSIWVELQGLEWDPENGQYLSELNSENVALWDQEMMAYRYVDTPTDTGHDQFFLPGMGLKREDDLDHGRSNFCETIRSEDFKLGESGVKLDFYISDAHEDALWWEHSTEEVVNQILSDMYLNNIPQLQGKQVIVRVIAEDVTPMTKVYLLEGNDFFFQDNSKFCFDAWVTGITPEIAPNIHFITMSLDGSSYKDVKTWNDHSFCVLSHKAAIWTLWIAPDASQYWQAWRKSNDLYHSAVQEIMDNSEIPYSEYHNFRNKN